MKPQITVVALGGTIAMSPEHVGAGIVPQFSADDLVRAVPELADGADIVAETFCNVPSPHLTLDIICGVAMRIKALAESGCDGVVITHGTDTLEETAYTLDILLGDLGIPVVVTGAMRHPQQVGADGGANLLSAVRVACYERAKNCGVLVVVNDEIHSAQYVRKVHGFAPSAFCSAPLGAVGWVREGVPYIGLPPAPLPALVGADKQGSAVVPMVTVGVGADVVQVKSLLGTDSDGLVIAGVGGGHVPPDWVKPVQELAVKMPVVLCSRVGTGGALQNTYGYAGSEIDLLDRGVIYGGRLDGVKARILLCLLLRYGVADLSRVFENYANV